MLDYTFEATEDEAVVEITLEQRDEGEPKKKVSMPSVVGILENKGLEIKSYKETDEIENSYDGPVKGQWVFELPYAENRCKDCKQAISKNADRCRSCAGKKAAQERKEKSVDQDWIKN